MNGSKKEMKPLITRAVERKGNDKRELNVRVWRQKGREMKGGYIGGNIFMREL